MRCVCIPLSPYLHLLNPLHRPIPADDFFRNFAWRLTEFFCQLKRQRHRILSELHTRRLLDDDFFQFQPITPAQKFAHVLRQTAFQLAIQESLYVVEENSDSNRLQKPVVGRWSPGVAQIMLSPALSANARIGKTLY